MKNLHEFHSGAVRVKNINQQSWAKNLAGKYRDNNIDAVQSLLNDRKEDLQLEERGYL